MKSVLEEKAEQIEELCRINAYAHFDIRVRITTPKNDGELWFENKTYLLSELKLTINDIE